MANMDERLFSKAEGELFLARYEVFQAAQKQLEEIVDFLRKQHAIEGEGWQVGQNGFFRMKEEAEIAENHSDDGVKAKKPTA
jgi:hypothetical protein